jgi:PTH1 family peptidyl-tRNA hydrolase
VVLDDMNLDLGRLRLRAAGSDGGHNGLASVVQALGTTAFPRLRIGIGPAPQADDHVEFVLGTFTEAERPVAEAAVDRAADAAELWVRRGLEPAMNACNRPTDDRKEGPDRGPEHDD